MLASLARFDSKKGINVFRKLANRVEDQISEEQSAQERSNARRTAGWLDSHPHPFSRYEHLIDLAAKISEEVAAERRKREEEFRARAWKVFTVTGTVAAMAAIALLHKSSK
jgi:hypothetical protein